jgi:FMN phosphatase YigB (HAD superfamily)
MKDKAIAFDFDGTLVHSGSDKSVHIMYAAYRACASTGFRRFLHPRDPGRETWRGTMRLSGRAGRQVASGRNWE